MTGTWTHTEIGMWESLGRSFEVGGHEVFAVDLRPTHPQIAGSPREPEPLLIIHGFPTSSFDFAQLAPALASTRRVVAVDMLGFGLSAKPDLRYTMALQADIVAGVVEQLGLDRLAMLTHDMGDTVGGELLARSMEGSWSVEVTRRIVTNGSIYIGMANLTEGQQMLLALPDERVPEGPGRELLSASLTATLAPANSTVEMGAHAEVVCHQGGDALLARTIRYVEERRANERRFTGAIESHPAALHIIWGPEDPIAVPAMADRLLEARPDASLTWIEGAGHYPQIEAPEEFTAAVIRALS